MSHFKHLHDKVLVDKEFRVKLDKDPSGALKSLGIESPTPELIAAVKELNEKVKRVGKDLGADVEELKECVT